jgi:hypothetical protein
MRDTHDELGLTREDYAEQAQRRRALEFRNNMGRVAENRKDARMKKVLTIGAFIVILIAGVLVLLASARADVAIHTPTGDYTIETFAPFGPAKIIHTSPMSDEAVKHDEQWMRECKPSFYMTEFGVMHYDFSKSPRGCEFGYLPGEVR